MVSPEKSSNLFLIVLIKLLLSSMAPLFNNILVTFAIRHKVKWDFDIPDFQAFSKRDPFLGNEL